MSAPHGGAAGASLPPVLHEVLALSESRGFVGGGDLPGHVRHAQAFAAAAGSSPDRVLDLGSGGGLPGLVLAFLWPAAHVALLDGSLQRATFLQSVVLETLGLSSQIDVLAGRAEDVARQAVHRGAYDLVVARAFGPPAVVAECAAAYLAPGGRLIVSEPPDTEGDRWAHDPELATLGLARTAFVRHDGFGFQILTAVEACPDRYPRRVGVPTKRPLF